MKRASFAEAECPVARSVSAVGDGWSLLIIRDALAGKRRFGEFERSLGAAKNILTARLKTLVAAGIFDLVPASDGGAHREYALTEKGQRLIPVIAALGQWAGGGKGRLVETKTGRKVRLELRSEDGRKLVADEVRLILASDPRPERS
jgi:DNA-binding HxlR family transcriptional regulator